MADHYPHHRRSIRLKDYDYTQNGAYFVTICSHNRTCLFGRVSGAEMVLNASGEIVVQEWEQTAVLRPYVELDAFVVMPNHVHGIIVITGSENGRGMMHHALVDDMKVEGTIHRAPTRTHEFSRPAARSLASIVGTFKAAVSRRINRLSEHSDHLIWQRNYYEHIIHSEVTLNRLRAYIVSNPAKWFEDTLYAE